MIKIKFKSLIWIAIAVALYMFLNPFNGVRWNLQWKLVDSDGVPIKDAKVFIHTLNSIAQFNIPTSLRYTKKELITDENGEFSFKCKALSVDVRIYANGFADTIISIGHPNESPYEANEKKVIMKSVKFKELCETLDKEQIFKGLKKTIEKHDWIEKDNYKLVTFYTGPPPPFKIFDTVPSFLISLIPRFQKDDPSEIYITVGTSEERYKPKNGFTDKIIYDYLKGDTNNIILDSLPIISIKCWDKIETNNEEYPTGGPHYYESWKTYHLPYRPKNPIGAEEVKSRNSYYEAYFTSDRKISKFTKIMNGQMTFTVTYKYSESGILEEGVLVKSTGDTTIQKFDENGKLIQ